MRLYAIIWFSQSCNAINGSLICDCSCSSSSAYLMVWPADTRNICMEVSTRPNQFRISFQLMALLSSLSVVRPANDPAQKYKEGGREEKKNIGETRTPCSFRWSYFVAPTHFSRNSRVAWDSVALNSRQMRLITTQIDDECCQPNYYTFHVSISVAHKTLHKYVDTSHVRVQNTQNNKSIFVPIWYSNLVLGSVDRWAQRECAVHQQISKMQ